MSYKERSDFRVCEIHDRNGDGVFNCVECQVEKTYEKYKIKRCSCFDGKQLVLLEDGSVEKLQIQMRELTALRMKEATVAINKGYDEMVTMNEHFLPASGISYSPDLNKWYVVMARG